MPVMVSIAELDVSALVTSGEISGWDALFAAIAVVVAWIAGRLTRRAVLKVLGRLNGISEDIRQGTARLAKYMVLLVGIGIALTFLGAPIQPLLAAAITAGVVGALALRGIADNFAAGVVLQTRRPIQLGDEIDVLGHVGTIIAMNGRSVVLETSDGRTVHVPNAKVLHNPFVNNSANAEKRSELQVRARRTQPSEVILRVISESLRSVEAIASDPAPTLLITAADPERYTVLTLIWHEPGSGPTATSGAVSAIAEAMSSASIDATVVTPPPDPPRTPPPQL
jgi:small-conductance mechanosensitive channel